MISESLYFGKKGAIFGIIYFTLMNISSKFTILCFSDSIYFTGVCFQTSDRKAAPTNDTLKVLKQKKIFANNHGILSLHSGENYCFREVSTFSLFFSYICGLRDAVSIGRSVFSNCKDSQAHQLEGDFFCLFSPGKWTRQ